MRNIKGRFWISPPLKLVMWMDCYRHCSAMLKYYNNCLATMARPRTTLVMKHYAMICYVMIITNMIGDYDDHDTDITNINDDHDSHDKDNHQSQGL